MAEFQTTPTMKSIGDIPVDGSMRAREILRCCAALEAFFDERLRMRPPGWVNDNE